MKYIVFMLLLLCSHFGLATTYLVGPTQAYVSPNALYLAGVVENGDTIRIEAGTYTGTAALAVWQADDLVIEGVGDRPRLDADGEYIWGKGIWVMAGNNISVANIEFFGASVPDRNGAGIRLDGIGLTVRHCYFHDNENGILTSNPYEGDITIEYCEFADNGYGDGFSHNLYIGHVNRLTFRFNYSHHARIGHNLKSRARENYILYNRIMDEESGTSSRLIDLSNGGFSIIMGNLLMQGSNAPNNNLIGYGLEGVPDAVLNDLYVINNTLVNEREASCLFLDLSAGTMSATVVNNIFAGSDNVVNNSVATLTTNVVVEDLADAGFVNAAAYDYELDGSPALDAGSEVLPVNGISLVPDSVYVHPTAAGSRFVIGEAIDIGALELFFITSATQPEVEKLKIYPNPASGFVQVEAGDHRIERMRLLDMTGKPAAMVMEAESWTLPPLPAGAYVLEGLLENGAVFWEKIILE